RELACQPERVFASITQGVGATHPFDSEVIARQFQGSCVLPPDVLTGASDGRSLRVFGRPLRRQLSRIVAQRLVDRSLIEIMGGVKAAGCGGGARLPRGG